MLIKEEDYLAHYGTKRHSGRYPWGSGKDPQTRSRDLMSAYNDLKQNTDMSEKMIAEALGFKNTTELRNQKTYAINVIKLDNIAMAERLKNGPNGGMSTTAIAERMFGDKSKESTVRGLLAPGVKDRALVLTKTADAIREKVDQGHLVDVGKGNANQLGITPTKLNAALSVLKNEGYEVFDSIRVPQVGMNQNTTTKVIAPPGTEYKHIMQNKHMIQPLEAWSNDGGRSWEKIEFPLSVSSKRLQVVGAEHGGDERDGVIYVRPGVKDLDMGGTHYAQGRILVDGTHYLKGMVVQKDNLPDGVDIQFHTNKSEKTPLLGPKENTILKPVQRVKETGEVDPDNPFGSSIDRQVKDSSGKLKSAINIVNDEGNWDNWSRNLASQMLSKQKPELIKSQLEVTYAQKKAALDEIKSLTNPSVKARLLQSYADDMDASAVHLKAAAMPRQKTHVILPINSLKPDEVYAPGFNNGERVVLIRYPHGGRFEIPELTVNNSNREGKAIIKPETMAAIGIHHSVAKKLSGADFDGDTVVVIPNNHRRIATAPPLKELKDFDPQHDYPGKDEHGNPIPGVQHMKNTQAEMGKISNLITDMTIQGATHEELARAVKHSMVVIDAEKHGLNYKKSYIDNGIEALKKRYQTAPHYGASTIISRAKGEIEIPDRRLRKASEGGPIDPKTGKLVYVETNYTRGKRNVDPETGEVTWTEVPKTTKVAKAAYFDDAHQLIDGDGTVQERMYADYANRVKDLANQARLELVHNTKPIPANRSAKDVYHKQVASLEAKLDDALKNAPLERWAQRIAGHKVQMKKQDNPDLWQDKDQLKKVQSQALREARDITGASKHQVKIEPDEWEAIQAGAITPNKLKAILDNADIDKVKQLATPKETGTALTSAKLGMARALLGGGRYTQAEVAKELGVSVSTLRRALKG